MGKIFAEFQFRYYIDDDLVLVALKTASEEGKKWVRATDVAKIILPKVKSYVERAYGKPFSKRVDEHSVSISVGYTLKFGLLGAGKVVRDDTYTYVNRYKPSKQ